MRTTTVRTTVTPLEAAVEERCVERPMWVDYGHSNRSDATSHKSLEANTTSSEKAPADAPRSKQRCPGRENGSAIKVFCVVVVKSFYRVDAD
jgi:hypothetical protein